MKANAEAAPSTSNPPAFKVGDVVEHVYNGRACVGIVFLYNHKTLDITTGDVSDISREVTETTEVKKIGETYIMDDVYYYSDADRLAKAYFAAKPPVFSGTYQERQAQWIKHHDLKLGSQVRVVQKFEKNEDGWNGYAWNHSDKKSSMQGKVYSLEMLRDDAIRLNNNLFPYFALEPA